MALIDPILGVRLVFLLGITNIISFLLVFFSCRCMAGTIVNKLFQSAWYRKFYELHCYYWWIFISSVLLHTILAFLMFGNHS